MPTKVLIIDDELPLRRTLRGTLEEEDGWELEDGGFEYLEFRSWSLQARHVGP